MVTSTAGRFLVAAVAVVVILSMVWGVVRFP